MTAQEYQNLKSELSSVQNKISSLEGKRSALVSQLKEILSRYSVKNVAELEELYKQKKEAAEKTASEIREYIDSVKGEIEQAEMKI